MNSPPLFIVEFYQILKQTGVLMWRRRRPLFLYVAALLLAGYWLSRWDALWCNRYTSSRTPFLLELAGQLRHWGRLYDTFTFSALAMFTGVLLKRKRWILAGKACLIGAAITGLSVAALRGTTGRPRPCTIQGNPQLVDRWTGPTLTYSMQSFPSGHTGTSFGAATALAVVCPVLAAPALLSATSVAWSSFYTQNHYITDIVVGGGLGIAIGIFVAMAARQVHASHKRIL